MRRRHFILSCAAVCATLGLFRRAFARAGAFRELKIKRIVVQSAIGRRPTPVAPNAYSAYRGYDVSEPVLRIQSEEGLEGISHSWGRAEDLKKLLGRDPFKLFEWRADGVIDGVAEKEQPLLSRLGGADVALIDLLGKAMNRPASALLGKMQRDKVGAGLL